jgi:hypothetical protein
MKYYKNVGGETLEAHSEQIRLDDYLIKPQKEIGQIKSNPLLSEISPPPLGIDPDKIPPRKYPPLGIMPIGSEECEKKWLEIAMISRFASEEAMIKAKEEFLKNCNGGLGSSVIAEPDLGTPTNPLSGTTSGTTGTSGSSSGTSLPNLGAFLGSLTGGANGGASAGASEQITETPKAKKPFPYWILIAGLVGGYLIFRKK